MSPQEDKDDTDAGENLPPVTWPKSAVVLFHL